MEHNKDAIKRELITLSPSIFATKWFFDSIPFIFENNYEQYAEWRHELSEKIDIDPSDIIITGSASLGFSLNPNKNFKEFNNNSDIDICIFSEYYFTIAWHDLLNLSPMNLSNKMNAAVKEHRNRYIYWGTIATDQILPLLSFGPVWARIIPQMAKYKFLEDHEIHFRIYRDRRSFRSYLLGSIENRRIAVMEGL